MPLKIACFGILAAALLHGQTPDEIVFVNGDKLIGKVEQADDKAVKFKSDMVGEITVEWSKLRELQSSQQFAVIPRNVQVRRHTNAAAVPQGKIAVADQKIVVTPSSGAPQTIAPSDEQHIVEESAFQQALEHNPSLLEDWKGTVTAGASLVEATQKSRTYTSAVSLVRTLPPEEWLLRRNRTQVNFSSSYGLLKQPGSSTIKTDILHGDAERDEYFSRSVFGFGQATFDHNFSQGLDLQQTYGGGLGWSVLKRGNQSLDLRGGLNYIRQNFTNATQTQSLLGSTFEEDYKRGLLHGATFTEQLIITPAWNNVDAISGVATSALTVPVNRRLNFTLGVIDNYLHDPPSGFKKNSFQANLGLSYTIR